LLESNFTLVQRVDNQIRLGQLRVVQHIPEDPRQRVEGVGVFEESLLAELVLLPDVRDQVALLYDKHVDHASENGGGSVQLSAGTLTKKKDGKAESE
jgi:hypothetical protein